MGIRRAQENLPKEPVGEVEIEPRALLSDLVGENGSPCRLRRASMGERRHQKSLKP